MHDLERTGSTFDKEGIIRKRKKWAIIAAISIIVLVSIAVGAGVAASSKKHSKNKDKQGKGTSSLPSVPAKPTVTKPSTTRAESVQMRSIQRETQLGGKVNPKLLDSFLKELVARVASVKANLPGGIDFQLPDNFPVSVNSLLMYIRDMDVQELWQPLLDYADNLNLDSLSVTDLVATVKAAKKMLTPKAVKEWGKRLAQGHDLGAISHGRSATNFTQLRALAGKAKKALPKFSVKKAAVQSYLDMIAKNTSITPLALPKAGRRLASAAREIIGRKLAAGEADFADLCIPVVFHVLQFEFQGSDGNIQLYPGVDTEGGFRADAMNLIDVTNSFFANLELEQLFKQPATPTKVQFRLEAVVQSPTDAPYLGVTQEEWATCSDNLRPFMTGKAAAISETYPPTKFINVIVCGDPGDGSGTLGYAFVPQGPKEQYDETASMQHVFLRTDEFFAVLNNNADSFNRGATTLTHELGHHLGLFHPHPNPKKGQGICDDGDNLADTPTTQVVQDMPYYSDLNGMCDTWRLQGEWPVGPGPDGYTLGLMSSCAPAESIDPVFNLMEYTPTSCYSYFTPQQVAYLQTAIPYYRPLLYQNSMGACPAAAAVAG